MLDLHCHILAGIDDGPDNRIDSIAMAKVAAEQGIETIAATPHLRNDFPQVTPALVAELCADLEDSLPIDAPVHVVTGGEVDLWWAAEATDEELRQASFGGAGKDLLVETPYGALSGDFTERLFQLRLKGFRVLLAHPEINPTFHRSPDLLAELVDQGVLVQVTARSLLRGPRSKSGAYARHLVAEGVAHVIASDAHGPGPWRPPDLQAGRDAARELAGARADWMVEDAPRAVLAGEPLPPEPSGEPPRRRGWPRRS